MLSKVEAIISREAWLKFLYDNEDLIVTGWEMVEVPALEVVDESSVPYDSRILYILKYKDRKFFIWDSEIESMICEEDNV